VLPRTRPRRADLQQVNLTLRVLSRPEVAQLPKIYSVRRTRRLCAAAARA
jgi:hypothetical protein